MLSSNERINKSVEVYNPVNQNATNVVTEKTRILYKTKGNNLINFLFKFQDEIESAVIHAYSKYWIQKIFVFRMHIP